MCYNGTSISPQERKLHMTHNEFKDRLFDILNETDEMEIADIETYDRKNQFKVVVSDGSQFIITIEPHGNLYLLK